ncbi:MAG: hypothetical protein Q4E35_02975 [Eubacteriales bacterium]|nr:hypothetical protein [Eubacteriales bacterium]
MAKEKKIVCFGIFMILAVLGSCALFYSVNTYGAAQGIAQAAAML